MGGEGGEKIDSESEKKEGAKEVCPNVDGVVIDGEEGGAETCGERGDVGAITSDEVVIIAHPGG